MGLFFSIHFLIRSLRFLEKMDIAYFKIIETSFAALSRYLRPLENDRMFVEGLSKTQRSQPMLLWVFGRCTVETVQMKVGSVHLEDGLFLYVNKRME